MKFACTCGHVIRDQTDYLPYAGYLIADQDVYDATEMSDRGSGDWWPTLTRSMYQCDSCGRLWIDDHNRQLKSFMPEQPATNFLSSIHGGKWKRVLRGSWTDDPAEASLPRGFVSWTHLERGDQKTFDDWESLEAFYRLKFEELKGAGILRDAMLTKNGDRIHYWELNPQSTTKGEQAGGDRPATRDEVDA